MSDFVIENGVLKKYKGNDTMVKIPEDVTIIDERAFEYCHTLENVDLPDNLLEIRKKAFDGCNNLQRIKIPNKITVIEKEAFSGCVQLSDVIFPPNLTKIEEGAFCRCNLQNIALPDHIQSIGNCAFSYNNLESVYIPVSVTEIGYAAFGGAKEIHIHDNIDPDVSWNPDEDKIWNGLPNSNVSWLGLNMYPIMSISCFNAYWNEHVLVIHSAETDKVKYTVRMPAKGSSGSVYKAFLTYWGPHANILYSKLDPMFKKMDASMKTNYAIDRLTYEIDLSDDDRLIFIKHLTRNAQEKLKFLLDRGCFELLDRLSDEVMKNVDVEMIIQEYSSDETKTDAVGYLLAYTNRNRRALETKRQMKQKQIEEVMDASMDIIGHEGVKGLVFAADINSLRTFYGKTELKRYLEANGAKLSASVTTKVHYFIEGSERCAAAEKANEFGIAIISEEKFNEMAGRDPEYEHSKIDKKSPEYQQWAWNIKTETYWSGGKTQYVASYKGDESHLEFPAECNGKPIGYISDNFAKRSNMKNVRSIRIPEGYDWIGLSAFATCKFDSIILPRSLSTIGEKAFMDCNFESIVIPPKVTILEHWLFRDCRRLKNVYLTGTQGRIVNDGNIFRGCRKDIQIFTIEGSLWNLHGRESIKISKDEMYRMLDYPEQEK